MRPELSSQSSPLGSIVAELKASVITHAEPEDVFRYFVEEQRLARWIGSSAHVQAVTGGRLEVDADGRHIEGRFLEVVVPLRALMTWRIFWPGAHAPIDSRLELAIRTVSSGTRIEAVHWGLPQEVVPRLTEDWAGRLVRLETALFKRAEDASHE